MASRDDMNVGRTTDFERDQSLESVLAEINSAIPDTMTPPYNTPQMPVVFIVGAPRSGTTLMSQWLSASGLFAMGILAPTFAADTATQTKSATIC